MSVNYRAQKRKKMSIWRITNMHPAGSMSSWKGVDGWDANKGTRLFETNAAERLLQQLGSDLHRADLTLGRAHLLRQFREPLESGVTHGHLAARDPVRVGW